MAYLGNVDYVFPTSTGTNYYYSFTIPGTRIIYIPPRPKFPVLGFTVLNTTKTVCPLAMHVLSFLTFNCGCFESMVFSWLAFCSFHQWAAIHRVTETAHAMVSCGDADALPVFLTVWSHRCDHVSPAVTFDCSGSLRRSSCQCSALIVKPACRVCIRPAADHVLVWWKWVLGPPSPKQLCSVSPQTSPRCQSAPE